MFRTESEPESFHWNWIYDNKTNTVSNSFMEMKESKTSCSKFWQYLNPEEEKRIILKSSDSIDEFSNSESQNNDKFAIPAKWWFKWWKFV